MANPEHVEILKRGAKVWNKWRSEHEGVRPSFSDIDLSDIDLGDANLVEADFRGANLSGANLSGARLRRAYLGGANLRYADLHHAIFDETYFGRANLRDANLRGATLGKAELDHAKLSGANLVEADLHNANLVEADLHHADLGGATLGGAILSDANLSDANLSDADLRGTTLGGANLSGANLSGARLRGATLGGVTLGGANLTNARLAYTMFAGSNLSEVKGLETVEHLAPSHISIDTIYASQGKIPEIFLRGCGVPESFIVQMRALVGSTEAIQFYSCFISYSSKDHPFAERLHADLQSKGVRCWFAPEDLKIGDRFRDRIDESIRLHDKLLIVLSEHSVASPWVSDEVEAALEREHREGRTVLFPIKIDEAVTESDKAWAASIRRTRHIGDFTRWKEHDSYSRAFDRLMRDLKAEEVKP